ncbi:molybdate ABC transporter permease subunit [Flammeovirga kamogawensis]|uniref:Molybdenum transport system permease n=1 Tax=Flammeovirga kamogawensis TaxID=373891 RepID=A0ABX8GY43_9BACT|nr:molybdate ABC transporter permease subunit [Flammeovirga kamogawensis]MBB6460914.1 molybdate transport system permease protein [Flammeovirga kamogawensis]QWG08258.1 molybdate ABC transporter permease subunit [Flammeovirga kamogawensis]
MIDWSPLLLTFKLACITTLCLLFIGIPLALFISRQKSYIKAILESIVSLPIVLPPTVLGFYLLLAFSPNNMFGKWLDETFGLRLIFSFTGLVVGSLIYSLPFMVQPVQAGFQSLPKQLSEAALLLGKSKLNILFKVLLPNMKPAILTGIVLSFAHTIGEFGVVLMIGGNISNKTRVASIAIYDQVERLDYTSAGNYSIILFVISFCILFSLYFINNSFFKK